MAIFGKKQTVNRLDELIVKACTGIEGYNAALDELHEEVQAAFDAWEAAASAYYARVTDEVTKRRERLAVIEAEGEKLRDDLAQAESRLGVALVAGDADGEKAAEAEMDKITADIARVEHRISIFKAVEFTLDAAAGYAAIEEKRRAYEDKAKEISGYVDVIDEAVQAHLNGYADRHLHDLYTGYPADVRTIFPVTGNMLPEHLAKFSRKNLTIDSVMDLVGGDKTTVIYK